MQAKTIKQSIDINAPKNRVWQVLMNEEHLREWYAIFGDGSHAETDWKPGSKVLFVDKNGDGLAGKIVVNEPEKEIRVEYTGIVAKGLEDYEGDIACAVKGGIEQYVITETNAGSRLDISCDMGEAFYDQMYKLWEQALQKIKSLAEAS